MAASRRLARPRFTLLLLVLTAVTLLTLDDRGAGPLQGVKSGARDVVAPVQDAARAVFSPVGNVVGGLFDYGRLEAENERLRAENDELRGRLAAADDAERERQNLIELENLDYAGDIPRVSARVITTSGSNLELTIELDKGRADGVAEGMPVVTGAGLVGRVTEVSSQRATVRLITDPRSSVGVRLARSGDVGVAGGAGAGRPLPVDLVDPTADVDVDDVVVTSGLQQSVFPPGVPVGEVERADAEPGALQLDLRVRPAVDFSRLSFVQVLQWSPQSARDRATAAPAGGAASEGDAGRAATTTTTAGDR